MARSLTVTTTDTPFEVCETTPTAVLPAISLSLMVALTEPRPPLPPTT